MFYLKFGTTPLSFTYVEKIYKTPKFDTMGRVISHAYYGNKVNDDLFI